MYAVFETGGKQYRVTEGDVVFIERLNSEPGEDILFDKVLACSNGLETDFGKPYLEDSKVEARILGHGKNKKIVIFKYKAKKGYRKKQGHRQPYSKVRIERIVSGKFGSASYVAAVEGAGADIVEDIAEDIVEDIVEDVVEDVVEDIIEDIVDDVVEDVVDDVVNDVIVDIVEDEIIENIEIDNVDAKIIDIDDAEDVKDV